MFDKIGSVSGSGKIAGSGSAALILGLLGEKLKRPNFPYDQYFFFLTSFKTVRIINSALREAHDVLRRRERVKHEGRIWWCEDISEIV